MWDFVFVCIYSRKTLPALPWLTNGSSLDLPSHDYTLKYPDILQMTFRSTSFKRILPKLLVCEPARHGFLEDFILKEVHVTRNLKGF